MISTTFSILDNLKNIEINNKELFVTYSFEFKDCIVLALNFIWDLIHEPLEIKTKDNTKNNKENKDINNKMHEMTVKFYYLY